MLTIYGNLVSTPSNKVRFVANALGLPYEYKELNLMAGDNKTPAYLAFHPAGKVPSIDDDGFVLFESNAIIRYLAAKADSPLYPKDLKRRAIVDQWIDFSTQHIGLAMGKVFVNTAAYKILKLEIDERSLKDGLSFLERFLPVLETQLEKNRYLAGSELSLADFALLAHLDQAEVATVVLSEYPQLKKWRDGLQAQDFYQKVFPNYATMLQGLAQKLAS